MAKLPIHDIGVSLESRIFAHIPSEFAKSALFYLIFSGHFVCNKNYRIERNYLDMFLLIYILKGQLFCTFEDCDWIVKPGQIILIDCKNPHLYYSSAEHTEFQWFHFSGNSCQAYYNLLKQRNLLQSSPNSSSNTIHIAKVIQMMEQPVLQEQTASVLIHTILRDISENGNSYFNQSFTELNWVIEYIHENYTDKITVEELARKISVSKYHFIRIFKKATGSTPHEYIINLRIKRAMELMTDSNNTIEAVSSRCGFNSASHFARCFRKVIGVNPSAFRILHSVQTFGQW